MHSPALNQKPLTALDLLQDDKDFAEPAEEAEEVNSKLFMQFLPIIGKTPMRKSFSLHSHTHALVVFFVAESRCGASDRVKNLIRKHGGICTEFHECCTIQIKPNVHYEMSSFYPGEIYEETWLYKCISANKIVKKEEFFLMTCPSDKGQRLNLSKRKRFTIMEGLTLYKILGKKKVASETNQFWQRIVENNKLPERSVDSLKKFWQVHENKTQEEFLCESIFHKVDFCLSFKEIPLKDELETKLRGTHFEVFELLEMQAQD